MIKNLLYISALMLCIACSTRRQMEKTISYGNYDRAISDAIGKLQINKDRKGKTDIIILLEEAFNNLVNRALPLLHALDKPHRIPQFFLDIGLGLRGSICIAVNDLLVG